MGNISVKFAIMGWRCLSEQQRVSKEQVYRLKGGLEEERKYLMGITLEETGSLWPSENGETIPEQKQKLLHLRLEERKKI